jgi:hypothetical protein
MELSKTSSLVEAHSGVEMSVMPKRAPETDSSYDADS